MQYIFFVYLTKSDRLCTQRHLTTSITFFSHICSLRNFDSIIMWDTAVYTAFFSMKYMQTTIYIYLSCLCVLFALVIIYQLVGPPTGIFPQSLNMSTWPGGPSICVGGLENGYEIPIDQILGPSSSMDMLTFIATLLHNKVHLCSDIH